MRTVQVKITVIPPSSSATRPKTTTAPITVEFCDDAAGEN